MDIKKIFEKFEDKGSFIRTTSPSPVKGADKAALNRRGNQMFNDGKIEEARRVFMTTGYSDGMSRVGDYYKSQNKMLDALKMYWVAHDRNKSGPLIEQLAGILQNMINEEPAENDSVIQESADE
jgi:hypothetical protein